MYECQTCKNARHSKPLSIRLEPTPPDEKLAFVQNVLDVLIESRFGRGRSSQMVFNCSDRPELEPAVFFDLEDGQMTPCYAVGPEGRFGYQAVEAAIAAQNKWASSGRAPTRATSRPNLWDVAPPNFSGTCQ